MAMDHNQGRRGHFHRGRRGPDRRGPERRQGPLPEQQQVNRAERAERIDVEQIMRDIRSRIAQRSGVDLTNQQIQELAARRLEAILDPRGLKPELLEQLRRSAGERTVSVDAAAPPAAQSFPFDEATLYDSPNALLRFLRKLFRPLLRMMINPTPIAHALAQQSRLNGELLARDAERDRRQAEWNALHYEILQRLAVDVSRASIDAQSLLLRVESLAAKVDFNERRVRTMEGTQVQARPPRPQEMPQPAAVSTGAPSPEGAPQQTPPEGGQPSDAPRRRRRRRRGRRGPGAGVPAEAGAAPAGSPASEPPAEVEEGDTDTDEGFEEEVSAERVEHHEEVVASVEPSAPPAPVEETPKPPEEG
ncbi:MAG: hypothetical protein DMF88_13715 [Acidobacteria bacterium]|nr:MAG: hypothetical protein DMF88_13715 [Acidobacteriota bacterium]